MLIQKLFYGVKRNYMSVGDYMKKYAVYKGKTGYYYYEYYETPDDIKGTSFENMIPEYRFPVVLDGNGGYYHFDKDAEYTFVEIIESDEEFPLPLEKMFFKNDKDFKLGWISPEGDTYSCDYTGHTKAAKAIAANFFPKTRYYERSIGKAGWIKVIDSWDGTEQSHGQFVYSLSGKITSRQADKLFDLGLYDNPEVQQMLKESQDNL